MDKKTSLKRLKKLREVFASAKKTKAGHVFKVGKNKLLFDIDIFANRLYEENSKYEGCGTACCVAGTAGLIPEFRKAGLKTSVDRNAVYFDGAADFYAFANFFGISIDNSEDICDPEAYHEAIQEAKKKYMKKHPDLFENGELRYHEDWNSHQRYIHDMSDTSKIVKPRHVLKKLDALIKEVEKE